MIFIDVFLMCGWNIIIIACILEMASLMFNNKTKSINKNKFLILLNKYSIIFCLVTIVGYTTDEYIINDYREFLENNISMPENRNSFILASKNQLSWISRMRVINYSKIDGVASIKFRIFPYNLVEYNSNYPYFLIRPFWS